jgi:C-terminal processing protease CtpA/Prc
VAYLKLNAFPGTPESLAAVRAFMTDYASAKAIIFDARQHRGGGMPEMNVILPYLYARPTTLVHMDLAESVVRANGPPPSEVDVRPIEGPPGVLRREHRVTPHKTERRLFDAKVFYLTSPRTASAAEHLALAFKHTGRAVLIGEPTAGANHFGGYEPIGQGLSFFLPVGRTLDPATGADWEGVGIAPDIAVPADQALDEALKRATAG